MGTAILSWPAQEAQLLRQLKATFAYLAPFRNAVTWKTLRLSGSTVGFRAQKSWCLTKFQPRMPGTLGGKLIRIRNSLAVYTMCLDVRLQLALYKLPSGLE